MAERALARSGEVSGSRVHRNAAGKSIGVCRPRDFESVYFAPRLSTPPCAPCFLNYQNPQGYGNSSPSPRFPHPRRHQQLFPAPLLLCSFAPLLVCSFVPLLLCSFAPLNGSPSGSELRLSPLRFLDSNTSGKSPRDMRIPPLKVETLLESNPPKSRSFIRSLAVGQTRPGCMADRSERAPSPACS